MIFRRSLGLFAAVAIPFLAVDAAQASNVRSMCPAENSPDYFAPADALPADAEPLAHQDYADQSAQLLASGEKSISCGDASAELVLRFSLWRRNTPQPFIISLTQNGDVVEVKGRMRTGKESGLIEASRRLTVAEWTQLQKLMTAEKFWQQSSSTKLPQNVRDAATWVLEGRTGGQYHRVEQRAPGAGSARALGRLLAVYVGWDRML